MPIILYQEEYRICDGVMGRLPHRYMQLMNARRKNVPRSRQMKGNTCLYYMHGMGIYCSYSRSICAGLRLQSLETFPNLSLPANDLASSL